jgi:DNA-binding protein H-NS
MATSAYAKLKEEIAKLEEQAAAAREQEVAAVIADIRAKIAEFGLSPRDLGFSVASASRRGGKGAKSALPPKYRDPKTGATWSGRGRHPSWIKTAKNPDRFLIENQ